MGVRRASSKLRKAIIKMVVTACNSFSFTETPTSVDLVFDDSSVDHIPGSRVISPTKTKSHGASDEGLVRDEAESMAVKSNGNNGENKNLCAICLEALSYGKHNIPRQAIFTAQCSHAFHFTCILSYVRHGSVTCPICRAPWSQLPQLNRPYCQSSDPVLRILDDSIATVRVNRRSMLHSACHDDDDPIETNQTADYSCLLDFSLVTVPQRKFYCPYRHQQPNDLTSCSSMLLHQPMFYRSTSSTKRRAASTYLSVKLAQPRAVDIILVVTPSGPHLRLLKQSMALVVSSLRHIDRLAIATYTSSAARIFPLRRMTSYGKRTALQVIERLFYMGQANPTECINKGIKILQDRTHKNPLPCILHLSDSPIRPYHGVNMQVPIPIHRFDLGFGYSTLNRFVMDEFEDYLGRLLRVVIRDVQLRIGEEGQIIKLGELKQNEERRILLDLNESGLVRVGYSYLEGDTDECTTGEAIVSINNESVEWDAESKDGKEREVITSTGRASSVESLNYHDPYMARRWAKYLNGNRF